MVQGEFFVQKSEFVCSLEVLQKSAFDTGILRSYCSGSVGKMTEIS